MTQSEFFELIRAGSPVLAALLAGGVAWKFGSIQAGIARQQAETAATAAKTARTKLRLDLFEKRFAVYEATNALIRKAVRRQKITDDDRHEFYMRTESAAWLFNEEVARFIEKIIFSHAFDLVNIYDDLGATSDPVERNKLNLKRKEMLEIFDKSDKELRRIMAPYLRFTEKEDIEE